MTKEQIVGLLEDVLYKTYVPDLSELCEEERSLEYLKTPEGSAGQQSELRKIRGSPGANTDNIDKILGNWAAYIEASAEAVKQKRDRYERGKKEYEAFMKQHHGVIDYIADLMGGEEEGLQPPSEELVFDTLTRLSGNLITGKFGVGSEESALGVYSDIALRDSIYTHAGKIGEDPEAYLKRIESKKKSDFIVS